MDAGGGKDVITTLATFLTMGGYGAYVWSAYIAMALMMTGALWLLQRQKRRLLAAQQ